VARKHRDGKDAVLNVASGTRWLKKKFRRYRRRPLAKTLALLAGSVGTQPLKGMEFRENFLMN
jgi:hypothetical protein